MPDHGWRAVDGFRHPEADQTEALGWEVCQTTVDTPLTDPVIGFIPGVGPVVLTNGMHHETADPGVEATLETSPLPGGVEIGHLHTLEAGHVAGDDKPDNQKVILETMTRGKLTCLRCWLS